MALTPVTLREVAVRAGVSLAAASFSLRGSHKVSAATRARVCRIAARAGYRVDARVSEVMRRVRLNQPVSYRETIAVLDMWPARGGWKVPITNRHYARGIALRAKQLGYRTEEFWLGDGGLTPRRVAQVLQSRGIRGVIVPPVVNFAEADSFDWDELAAVTIGPSFTAPVHRVCNHRFRTVWLALEALHALGYERVGFVMPRHPLPHVNDFWCSGFHTYQAAIPPERRVPVLLHPGDVPVEIRSWFATHRPDALILHYPKQLTALAAAGIRVPQECAVAYANWEPGMTHLAGIDQRPVVMGAMAVDCLFGLLVRNELGLPEVPQEIMIGSRWVAGPSAPPRWSKPSRRHRAA